MNLLLPQGGVRCRLLTGEEVRDVPKATHTACTIEMAYVPTARAVRPPLGWRSQAHFQRQTLDVAVLDEIQVGLVLVIVMPVSRHPGHGCAG